MIWQKVVNGLQYIIIFLKITGSDKQMRLAMAQTKMADSLEENLQKSIRYMQQAKEEGADMIFFPEVQLSPFFAQEEKQDVSSWLVQPDGSEITTFCDTCRRLKMWASPNVYLDLQGKYYDASLMIDPQGKIVGISKMVHIFQAEHFYEQDYYTPSPDGFHVYETPFGKVGIIICFDRHIPTSIRACAKQGAELVLIPTANLTTEPMELYEWEIRVQAFQNQCYIAMCNRVGPEKDLVFAGESLVSAPTGELLCKADGNERLCLIDVPLHLVRSVREKKNWLQF